jgi:beta-glucosidase/6-phospho-beta-glucosidase/beta-galactosidase
MTTITISNRDPVRAIFLNIYIWWLSCSVFVCAGIGDIDSKEKPLPVKDALNDHARLDYLQRHISVLKDAIEYVCHALLVFFSHIYI